MVNVEKAHTNAMVCWIPQPKTPGQAKPVNGYLRVSNEKKVSNP